MWSLTRTGDAPTPLRKNPQVRQQTPRTPFDGNPILQESHEKELMSAQQPDRARSLLSTLRGCRLIAPR